MHADNRYACAPSTLLSLGVQRIPVMLTDDELIVVLDFEGLVDFL
jgi:hypothetical protein